MQEDGHKKTETTTEDNDANDGNDGNEFSYNGLRLTDLCLMSTYFKI